MSRTSPGLPPPSRASTHGAVAATLAALLFGCTYERDPRLGIEPERALSVVRSAPAPGTTGVDRRATIDVVFDAPPRPVARVDMRVYAGLIEIQGTRRVDLVARRVRFTPAQPLRASLRHQVFLRGGIRGLDGSRLEQDVIFEVTTGETATPPAAAPPAPSGAAVAALLGQRCARCHGSYTPPGGVDLSSRDAMLGSLRNRASTGPGGELRVAPGDHARSYVMFKLLDMGGFAGFAMPPEGQGLSRSELRLVADWIDGGAR